MTARPYEDAIQYLYGLQRLGIKFGLENITRVLSAIGNPQRRLATIHIAGSNGKGSTAAHLESILLQAGYRVGLYTSPHFIRFTERIRVDREAISEEKVVRWTRAILEALPELRAAGSQEASIPITFFEFTTAMAMAHFVHEGVELAILETGMGGRLDATNICHPLVCVITTISLEHQEFLGRTLVEIAGEKAGIIKLRVPVVCGVSHPRAREVVEAACRKKAAPFHQLGREFQASGVPQAFSYRGINFSMHGLHTSLRGRHQVRNAGLALAAAEILVERGYEISPEAMERGLRDVRWRGRQEWHPGPPQVLLDGAHNPEAIRSLCASLRRDYRFKRLRILMGVMREKDHRRMIALLSPMTHEFVFSRPRLDRAQDPWVLQAEARRLGRRATVAEEVEQGFQDLLQRAEKEDMICVTGSLFAVGEVLALLEKNDLQAG